jgi:hypothetical protein
MPIDKILEEWLDNQKQPYTEFGDARLREIQHQNIEQVKSRIPQIKERIEKEILGEKTIANLFSGKKIIKSKLLPRDEIWIGEGATRSEQLNTPPEIINTLKGGKE